MTNPTAPADTRRVRLDLPDGSGSAEGVVVDDFSDLLKSHPTEVTIDHDHIARLRRWAVGLDGGGIVFTDSLEFIDAAESDQS
ncbi:hypothetical protein QSJ19_22885 [Gordonia sp. ABSL11-1]|uniref:hypothetical protein n=1 Tax=Gordonia sp. ABSL11-1 TaxID=3053924 RepID=UPI00257480CB|nr:hypothetical protein [Gordonia sp. ABSL11-1]MDL9948371.1 hypothetical protein [Gordonia sp. ABSL11-1]